MDYIILKMDSIGLNMDYYFYVYMDYTWIIHGLYMDYIWIIYGFYMDSIGIYISVIFNGFYRDLTIHH